MVFAFDKEIICSDIYQRVLRGSLKDMIRQKQADLKLFKTDSRTRKFLRDSQKQPHPEFNILLTGELQSRHAILADILDSYKPLSVEECLQWREEVKHLCASRLRKVVEAVADANVKPQQIDLDSASTLLRQLTANSPFEFDNRLAEAVEDFLKSCSVQSLLALLSVEVEKTNSDTLYVEPHLAIFGS